MRELSSMHHEELLELMTELGQPKFRASQIFEWVHKGTAPENMTNLPKQLREELSRLKWGGAKIYQKLTSKKDGTIKYLFGLEDGNIVEGVFMRNNYGNTLCLSTQVGCDMGCSFCASTLNGCVRDLTAGEMLNMVTLSENDNPRPDGNRSVTNIVMMGSGEPLRNYDQVVRFLKVITVKGGLNISPRNISLSTCGLPERILKFSEDAPPVTLCISLHAPDDETRSKLMPVNKKYPVNEVINAAKAYSEKTGRRIIFEYALIKDVNSSKEAAQKLCSLLRGINAHVNLIPLNNVEESSLKGVNRTEAEEFCAFLNKNNLSATVRRDMGSDIHGACGQLRRSALDNTRAETEGEDDIRG